MVDDDKKTDGAQDDGKPKPEVKPLDPEALGKAISDQVAAQVATALQTQADRPPAQPAQREPEDALGQVIEPYVRAGSAKATLIAQLAADKADFYTVSDPDELADRLAYKEEVEKRALALASAGRALPREDIFKHLKGEKEEEFFERKTKRKALKAKRAAEEGADHGADGVPRVRGGEVPSFVDAGTAHDLQDKGKLEEFLGDKSF